MRRSNLTLAGLVLLAVACRSLPRATPPAHFEGLPWSDAPTDRLVLEARGAVERGEPKRGLELLEGVLRTEPRHVDALRLRQDVLRERGRRGLLLHEAQQGLAAGEDALACYLHGRIVADQPSKLQSFARAVELAPDSLWPWLGLGHTLRAEDPARALDLYARLYAATEAHPLVAVAYGGLLRDREELDLALEVYDRLAKDPRVPGIGALGMAQTALALTREDDAWQALLEAVRLRPFDPSVQAFVRTWMQSGADRGAQVFDLLREAPAVLAAFGTGDGVPVLAELLQRSLQTAAAASLLAAPATHGHPALRRIQRRTLLALGDVVGFLQALRSAVPREVVAAEPNQLRARWLQLLDGPWFAAGDPLASAAGSLALLQALVAVGYLPEAEQLVALALQRWPEAADAAGPLTALRDEVRRQLAFESVLRRRLYQGYRDQDTTSLDDLLVELRAHSLRIFGRDVVGTPHVFRVPMVGELVDPFSGPLAAHLDRYNRHLILGRRAGGVPEAMLLSRLSLAELAPQPELPLPGRCFEVVAIDRDVRSLSGVVGGDLAGVALLNHFLVDFDAVRDWARTIAERRRVAAEDGGALLRDPLPADPGMDPLDVSWRLSVLSPVQDSDLESAVLDTIRHHERQHLVDSFHFLPIEQNLGRGLFLLLQCGLSPAVIQGEMERRAELASLACSPHTAIVLAHIADFLGEAGAESPHHRGFGELARQLVVALQRLGVAAADAAPSRWHLLPPAIVQQAARKLLGEL